MRTRTLLLLSVACGLAVLIAGGVQLLRVSNQSESVPSHGIGDRVEVGDVVVVVDATTEAEGVFTVDVDLGLVVAEVGSLDAAGGFRLIVPGGDPIAPVSSGTGACEATVGGAPCELRFDVEQLDSEVRTLHYQRGDESARWLLAGR